MNFSLGTHARGLALGLCLVAAHALLPVSYAEPGTSEDAEPTVDFKALENPIAYTDKSIARGKRTYSRYCTECHGPDGKAEIDLIADAVDLTQPKWWYSGSTPGEVFRSIRDGAGVSMPPYKLEIRREEDIWHLVNYVQSLWPKDIRPQLKEQDKGEEPSKTGGSDDE